MTVQIRVPSEEYLVKIDPRHRGHHHVREDEIEAFTALDEGERLLGALHADKLVILEGPLEHAEDHTLVVHHEDSSSKGARWRRLDLRLRLAPERRREEDEEPGALADLALHAEFAPERGHDPVGNGEAKPGACSGVHGATPSRHPPAYEKWLDSPTLSWAQDTRHGRGLGRCARGGVAAPSSVALRSTVKTGTRAGQSGLSRLSLRHGMRAWPSTATDSRCSIWRANDEALYSKKEAECRSRMKGQCWLQSQGSLRAGPRQPQEGSRGHRPGSHRILKWKW